MSEATRAKSAKIRASIAAKMLRGRERLGREFDDCFEMGDGDEVVRLLYVKAQTDTVLERLLRKKVKP